MGTPPPAGTGTTAVFGSYVLTRNDDVQTVLRDHWVMVACSTARAASSCRV